MIYTNYIYIIGGTNKLHVSY